MNWCPKFNVSAASRLNPTPYKSIIQVPFVISVCVCGVVVKAQFDLLTFKVKLFLVPEGST